MITGVILLLVVVGIVLYLVPMEAQIKGIIVKIAIVVAVVVVVLWLLGVMGIAIPGVRLP